LKKINLAKDKFFSILSHDLRNPFHSILGYLEILKHDYDGLAKEDVYDIIKSLHKSSSNLYNLLESLLAWSRLQSGEYKFHKEKINLRSVIDEVLDLYYASIMNKAIKISDNVPDRFFTEADLESIKTIIRNLISNAVKYTHLTGTISLLAEEDDENIFLSIKDNGIGISEEDLLNMFRIDVNSSKPGTMREKGTGLGLILCKDLLEGQGGAISVESELGKGSKFKIRLPK